MSTDFEQRLRSEMEQVDVRPRPDLVKAAYRSYRGNRRMMRAVAVTGAAAIAAGTAVGVVVATTSPLPIPAQTTAYVISHVSSALAATNRIAYTNTIFRVPKNAVLPHPNPAIRGWSYGIRYRTLRTSASGRPMIEYWVRTGHGKPVLILVNYQQRSWERLAYRRVMAPQKELCYAPEFFLILHARNAAAADWKPIVKSGLRCGFFHLAGHQRVDGIDAIKLTSRSGTAMTLWVDPHSYLPVLMAGNVLLVERPAAGRNGPGTTKATLWIHFRWLPPTRVNLAHLTGTIPPGFRQVGS